MRKSKKDQVTMLQLYPVFVKLFVFSLLFPLVAVVFMFSASSFEHKYIPVIDLPAEVQARIDFEESLFRAKDGTVVSIDLITYKKITQISSESVIRIYRVLGKRTSKDRINNGAISFFLSSMIYSIINGIIVAVLQNRREQINVAKCNAIGRYRP